MHWRTLFWPIPWAVGSRRFNPSIATSESSPVVVCFACASPWFLVINSSRNFKTCPYYGWHMALEEMRWIAVWSVVWSMFIFFRYWRISSSQLTNSYFSQGLVYQPPISKEYSHSYNHYVSMIYPIKLSIINHYPGNAPTIYGFYLVYCA